MFKDYILIGKNDSPGAIIEPFRLRVEKSTITNKNDLIELVELTARYFIARGQQLAGFDSIFQAKRVLQGDDYKVEVEVDYGQKEGFIKKMFHFLRK